MLVSSDIEAIAAVLHTHQEALNTSSTDEAVQLFTRDGVCMPQHAQSFVGIDNVRKAYEGFFEKIKFNIELEIKEILPTAPDWAFARTNSKGTTIIEGRGEEPEANQELYVFQKVCGKWKIARYCFSTTNPPPTQGKV
jgi:uncharacterized protein (TIGR02246 family)